MRAERSLRRERADHVRVDRAYELIAPGRQRRDVVRPRRDAREDLALEDAGAARVLDLDVVREGLVVGERDLEGGVRGGAELRRVERDVLGRQVHDGARGGCTGFGASARGRRGCRAWRGRGGRSEEHTSELQSQSNLVCRLLLEKKKK